MAFKNLVVESRTVNDPSAIDLSTRYGKQWIVGPTPVGDWTDHAGELAKTISFDDPEIWSFEEMEPGDQIYDRAADAYFTVKLDGSVVSL